MFNRCSDNKLSSLSSLNREVGILWSDLHYNKQHLLIIFYYYAQLLLADIN